MEVCESRHRSTVGVFNGLPWGLAVMVYGFMAYLIRDWRWLQFSMALQGLLLLPVLWSVQPLLYDLIVQWMLTWNKRSWTRTILYYPVPTHPPLRSSVYDLVVDRKVKSTKKYSILAINTQHFSDFATLCNWWQPWLLFTDTHKRLEAQRIKFQIRNKVFDNLRITNIIISLHIWRL